MNALNAEQLEVLRTFVEAHRATHLWFWRRDYVPQTGEEFKRALDLIAKRADVRTWQQIREFESWL